MTISKGFPSDANSSIDHLFIGASSPSRIPGANSVFHSCIGGLVGEYLTIEYPFTDASLGPVTYISFRIFTFIEEALSSTPVLE